MEMTQTMNEPLKVALLGCGVVGTQVARLILEQGDDLTARIGRPLELVGIAVRNLDRPRPEMLRPLLTTDADALVARDDVDIVRPADLHHDQPAGRHQG